MIHALTGTVTQITEQQVVLAVSGIEFSINVPYSHHLQEHSTINLKIYFHWHAEQGPTLYGFASTLEKTIFELIISCSGIGPKIGLASLANLKPMDIISAIQKQDISVLSSVPGIGTKKAEQIIMQLRHKIEKLLEVSNISAQDPRIEQWKNITDVLISLNYSRPEIARAMQHIRDTTDTNYTFDQILRTALAFLSKRI